MTTPRSTHDLFRCCARTLFRQPVATGIFISLACVVLTAGVANATCAPEDRIPVRTLQVDSSIGLSADSSFDSADFLGPKELVLTFDDGPLPGTTARVLKALDAYCAKATFFIVGRMARANPRYVERIANAGHSIGLHSDSHANLASRSVATGKREILRNLEAVRTGLNGTISDAVVPFFRFPYLRHTRALKKFLAASGMWTISADIDPADWKGEGANAVLNRILAQLKYRDRGIILLHDIKRATARMLPRLLSVLKARGYRLVHLTGSASGRQSVARLSGDADPIVLANAPAVSNSASSAPPEHAAETIPESGKAASAETPVPASKAAPASRHEHRRQIAKANHPGATNTEQGSVIDGTSYNFNGGSTEPVAVVPAQQGGAEADAAKTVPATSRVTFNFNRPADGARNSQRQTKRLREAGPAPSAQKTQGRSGGTVYNFNVPAVVPVRSVRAVKPKQAALRKIDRRQTQADAGVSFNFNIPGS